MPEQYFQLSAGDRKELLELGASRSGRPPHLLEKDVWVVWLLSVLFESPLGPELTFKGGTSLSKAYQVIDRFSEDIDITRDVRRILPDIAGDDILPATKSQAKKWTEAVRERLPAWIRENVLSVLEDAIRQEGVGATLEIPADARDKLVLRYEPTTTGTGYVKPEVVLEFGARATGEPNEVRSVRCDLADQFKEIEFPCANPKVLSIARTYWEKATATHVYCLQGKVRGDRYSRHWHDLAAIMKTKHFADAISDRTVAASVAAHKSMFFVEKARGGTVIDYHRAVSGNLRLVPQGAARAALRDDYAKMIEDGVLLTDAIEFDELMGRCSEVEARTNAAFLTGTPINSA